MIHSFSSFASPIFAAAVLLFALTPSPGLANEITHTKNDVVELAGTILDADSDAFLERIVPPNLDYEERTNYFMDTEERHLAQNNVIIRVRSEERNEYSSTVKVRPIVRAMVPEAFFSMKGFKCEIDENIFGNAVMACSFKVKIEISGIDEHLRTGSDLWSLVSSEQLNFLRAVRPKVSIDAPLHHYGPAKCRRLEFREAHHKRDLVVEEWKVGDKKLLELSSRTSASDVELLRKQFFSIVEEENIRFSDVQISKTAFVLGNSPR
jgi:hypothetical protein